MIRKTAVRKRNVEMIPKVHRKQNIAEHSTKNQNLTLNIPTQEIQSRSPKRIQNPRPNLNVKPKIDNKGPKSPVRSSLLSPTTLNKPLPDLSKISPKIDNKGINIFRSTLEMLREKKKGKTNNIQTPKTIPDTFKLS